MPRTVTVDTADGTMPLYDIGPEGARGAVVVVQEAFGVNGHVEDVARRFADQGYRAVAPHLFHRTGDPVLDYSDFEAVRPHMGALSETGLSSDLDATLDYLSGAGFAAGSTGIVGFCMGGTVAFLAATRSALGAAVTFYGGGVTEGRFGLPPLVDLATQLQAPWLGLFGDRDPSIPVDDVEALRAATARAPVETDVVRYEDAEHGFFCDVRPSFHPGAAADAWRRTLDWLAAHLAEG